MFDQYNDSNAKPPKRVKTADKRDFEWVVEYKNSNKGWATSYFRDFMDAYRFYQQVK